MHWKSDNKEFQTYDNVSEIADEVFKTLLSRHQSGWETSMKGSDFIFDSVQWLY